MLRTRFELARFPNGALSHRLNHSATLTLYLLYNNFRLNYLIKKKKKFKIELQ